MLIKKELSLKIFITILLGITSISHQLDAMEESQQEETLNQEARACSICMENYDSGNKRRLVTPCNHELCLACASQAIGQGYQHVSE